MTLERYEKEEADTTALGDLYDIYNMLTKVHSPVKEITRDWTMSNVSNNPYDVKIAKYAIKQLILLRVIEDFVLILDTPEMKKVKSTDEEGNTIEEEIPTGRLIANEINKGIFEKIKILFMTELHSVMILSRAVDGEILKALIRPIVDNQPRIDEPKEPSGTWEKIKAKVNN